MRKAKTNKERHALMNEMWVAKETRLEYDDDYVYTISTEEQKLQKEADTSERMMAMCKWCKTHNIKKFHDYSVTCSECGQTTNYHLPEGVLPEI